MEGDGTRSGEAKMYTKKTDYSDGKRCINCRRKRSLSDGAADNQALGTGHPRDFAFVSASRGNGTCTEYIQAVSAVGFSMLGG